MTDSNFFFDGETAAEPTTETEQPSTERVDDSTDQTTPQPVGEAQSGHAADVPTDEPEDDSEAESDPADHRSISDHPTSETSTDLAGLPWDEAVASLRERFPGKTEGILFCAHKLLSDPEAKLPDFRGEAGLRGIELSGRSLHSAKVLLGLAAPSVRRSPKKPATTEGSDPRVTEETADESPRARTASTSKPATTSRATTASKSTRRTPGSPAIMASPSEALEAAVRHIQNAAREEAESLRDAMRSAIEILQDALDD